jgi:hypothetical protein
VPREGGISGSCEFAGVERLTLRNTDFNPTVFYT